MYLRCLEWRTWYQLGTQLVSVVEEEGVISGTNLTAVCETHSTDAQVRTMILWSTLGSKTKKRLKIIYEPDTKMKLSRFSVRYLCLCLYEPKTAVHAVHYHTGHISKKSFFSSEEAEPTTRITKRLKCSSIAKSTMINVTCVIRTFSAVKGN